MSTHARVSGLYVYPLKSARGIALEASDVGQSGFTHDREFMVIDAAGRFVSQRATPQLACVATALEADGVRLTWHGSGGPRGELLLPFHGPAKRVETSIWRSVCHGDLIESATRWISEVCGAPSRIVRFAGERSVNPLYGRGEDRVRYADGYAVLVVNEGSRRALEEAAATPVPLDRFRANVVVEGWAAWAEDDVDEIVIGGVRLRFVKPCGRCAIISTDQRTGARSKEPLATLARLRRDASPSKRLHESEEAAKLIPFGENAVVVSAGRLTLGDQVRASAR